MLQHALASHRVGRVLGFEVRILYSLYLLLGILLITRISMVHSIGGVLLVLSSLLLYPFCIFLHEMGHSLAAIKEGLSVRKILLHPLGGLAMLEGHIPGPMAEIFIALAGPFVSLLLAALAFLPLLIAGETNPLAYHDSLFLAFFSMLFLINMIPALFNLLPIFPLDGGRVATAIAIMVWGESKGLQAMSKIGKGGLIVLALIGLLLVLRGEYGSGGWLIVLAVFLHFLGRQEMQARMYAAAYSQGTTGNRYSYGSPTASQEPWAQPAWSPEKGFEETAAAEKDGWFKRWSRKRQGRKAEQQRLEQEALQQQVDEILAKVQREGIGKLSAAEKKVLNRASRGYKE